MEPVVTAEQVGHRRVDVVEFVGGPKLVGSHLDVVHWFVQGKTYLRSAANGRCTPPGVSGEPDASAVFALLPRVVNVGRPVLMLTSHGAREAWFCSLREQPV